MIDHFPSSYQQYVAALHKKERQQAINKAKKNIKMMSIRQTNALKKAMKDSSEYNSILLQQRKEERASYYDMQTQLIHIPSRRNRKMPAHATVPSKYPVALLPGQYQDYYFPYNSKELYQFPLNSIVSFPPPPQPEIVTVPEAFQTLQDVLAPEPSSPIVTMGKREEAYDEPPPKRIYKRLPSGKKDPMCGICLSGSEKNKKGKNCSIIFYTRFHQSLLFDCCKYTLNTM